MRAGVEALLGDLERRLAQTLTKEQEAEALRREVRSSAEAAEVEQAKLRAALDVEWATLQAERRSFEDEKQRMDVEWAALRAERHSFEDEKQRMAEASARRSDVLTLNLGGERVVQRRRSTLCVAEDSFLAARFSGRWEQELDRDEEGRYFINYSPELFLPLLDYLSARETEGPGVQLPLPTGPESQRPQFQAMLKYFGILPATSVLEAIQVPHNEEVKLDKADAKCGTCAPSAAESSTLATSSARREQQLHPFSVRRDQLLVRLVGVLHKRLHQTSQQRQHLQSAMRIFCNRVGLGLRTG